MSSILRVAGKGVILYKGKVLILREADDYDEGTNAGRFQLPGGRIEKEEAFLEGLIREIKEETGLEVKPIRPIHVGEWWPEIKKEKNHIIGIYMLCKTDTADVRLSNEHDSFRWIDPEEIDNYDILPQVTEAIAKLLDKNA